MHCFPRYQPILLDIVSQARKSCVHHQYHSLVALHSPTRLAMKIAALLLPTEHHFTCKYSASPSASSRSLYAESPQHTSYRRIAFSRLVMISRSFPPSLWPAWRRVEKRDKPFDRSHHCLTCARYQHCTETQDPW